MVTYPVERDRMGQPPNLELFGLDDEGLQAITSTWNILDRHLSPYVDQDHPWFLELRLPANREQRGNLERILEERICKHVDSFENGLGETCGTQYETILFALAYELG